MDRTLVTRAQQGDRQAFTLLAGAITPPFLSVSHRILRDLDLAEDATQNALVSIWRRLPQLRDPDRFEAWSYRLLVHACYSEGKRSRRWSPNLHLLPTGDLAAPDRLAGVIDRDQLERAFRRLSFEHRTVVVLRHYQHLSLDEVSAALEIPVGTVASRLHYAMRELRSAIQADARPGERRAAT